MRKCSVCGILKPIEAFYAHPFGKDKHDTKCKLCQKAISTKARNSKLEYWREYDRNRADIPHRKDLRARIVSEYREKYPERYRANYLVHNAVRDNRLKKADSCQICNKPYHKLHGHHEDYSNPLEVIWMCTPCHKRWHIEHRSVDEMVSTL